MTFTAEWPSELPGFRQRMRPIPSIPVESLGNRPRRARYLGETEPWSDPPRRIMALADFGPEILYRTHKRVCGKE